MDAILGHGVPTLLCALFALGILLCMSRSLEQAQQRFLLMRRLRAERRAETEGEARQGIQTRLAQLMEGALGREIPGNRLLLLMFLLFLLVFGNAACVLRLPAALLAGGFAASLPCLLLRLRLADLRRRSSFEGEALLSELLRQYRGCGCNVFEALERSVAEGTGIRHSRKLLYSLLLELRASGSPERVRAATERFAYRIDTNWSRMLAHSIRLAAEKGSNISLSLEDVLIQLREARALAEERKRLNSESVRMVCVLLPLLYASTVFLAVRYLDVPPGRLLANQFGTPEGLLFFLLILALFLLNLALLALVNGQKFDF